ncbi:hypothetical protein NGUA28_01459 [Salmonella enterica]|nr:hypothetical protein NGUA28_01459 [Salmonella enterica]
MGRAGGVRECALGVGAMAAHRLQCGFHIARVVHGVEDAEHVHTVFHRAFDEALHHVVGVMAVAEQVLAAQQHLQRGFGHGFFEFAQAQPRVLAEETDAGVKGGAAPAFEGAVAHVVELSGNRQHVVKAQAGGEQGLVGVTQDDVGNGNGHGFLRKLRVKAAMVVDSGGNHRLEAGKVVSGRGGGRCRLRYRDRFRKETVDGGGHAADGENQQEQKRQHEPHAEEHQSEAFT